MADTHSGPGWSDAQWELIAKTVTQAFDKANVAGNFLPCYGPLPERDDYVRKEVIETQGNVVSVSDDTTLKLLTLTVKVPLSREQVRDGRTASALLAFRRAATLLAQVEDYLVFNGFASVSNQGSLGAKNFGTGRGAIDRDGTIARDGFSCRDQCPGHALGARPSSERDCGPAAARTGAKGAGGPG